VKLGRRDARGASLSKANKVLPTPTSSLSTLTSNFAAQGLSFKDMIALSGNFAFAYTHISLWISYLIYGYYEIN
jgi:Peroxidase